MTKKLILDPNRPTSPIIWFVAFVCTVTTVAVIAAGIIVLFIYVILHPKLPTMNITYAHQDMLDFDQYSKLGVQINLVLAADNENSRAHVSFSELQLSLNCHGAPVAILVAKPFDIGRNTNRQMNYVIHSSPIPLGENSVREISGELEEQVISFSLTGHARTSWTLGAIRSVKFYTHVYCQLQLFLPIFNGSSKSIECHSKVR